MTLNHLLNWPPMTSRALLIWSGLVGIITTGSPTTAKCKGRRGGERRNRERRGGRGEERRGEKVGGGGRGVISGVQS